MPAMMSRLLLAVVLVAGCQPNAVPKPTATTPPTLPNAGTPPAAATPTTPPVSAHPGAPMARAADAFVKLAQTDAAAAVGQFTPDLRGVFFSPDKAAVWLAAQLNGVINLEPFAPLALEPGAGTVACRATGQRAGQPVVVSLRLAPAAPVAVSFFLVTEVVPRTPGLQSNNDAHAGWVTEVAHDFLDAYRTAAPDQDFALAFAQLTPDALANLGPNANIRRQVWRPRQATLANYVVQAVGTTATTATVTGRCGTDGKFSLELTAGPAGWRVERFTITD